MGTEFGHDACEPPGSIDLQALHRAVMFVLGQAVEPLSADALVLSLPPDHQVSFHTHVRNATYLVPRTPAEFIHHHFTRFSGLVEYRHGDQGGFQLTPHGLDHYKEMYHG